MDNIKTPPNPKEIQNTDIAKKNLEWSFKEIFKQYNYINNRLNYAIESLESNALPKLNNDTILFKSFIVENLKILSNNLKKEISRLALMAMPIYYKKQTDDEKQDEKQKTYPEIFLDMIINTKTGIQKPATISKSVDNMMLDYENLKKMTKKDLFPTDKFFDFLSKLKDCTEIILRNDKQNNYPENFTKFIKAITYASFDNLFKISYIGFNSFGMEFNDSPKNILKNFTINPQTKDDEKTLEELIEKNHEINYDKINMLTLNHLFEIFEKNKEKLKFIAVIQEKYLEYASNNKEDLSYSQIIEHFGYEYYASLRIYPKILITEVDDKLIQLKLFQSGLANFLLNESLEKLNKENMPSQLPTINNIEKLLNDIYNINKTKKMNDIIKEELLNIDKEEDEKINLINDLKEKFNNKLKQDYEILQTLLKNTDRKISDDDMQAINANIQNLTTQQFDGQLFQFENILYEELQLYLRFQKEMRKVSLCLEKADEHTINNYINDDDDFQDYNPNHYNLEHYNFKKLFLNDFNAIKINVLEKNEILENIQKLKTLEDSFEKRFEVISSMSKESRILYLTYPFAHKELFEEVAKTGIFKYLDNRLNNIIGTSTPIMDSEQLNLLSNWIINDNNFEKNKNLKEKTLKKQEKLTERIEDKLNRNFKDISKQIETNKILKNTNRKFREKMKKSRERANRKNKELNKPLQYDNSDKDVRC